MKKSICLFIAWFLIACGDGDIFVEDLSFQDIDVEACLPDGNSGQRDYLFFKSNMESFETLSIQLSTSEEILATDGLFAFDIDATNMIEYRRFDAAPGNDYFCNFLPPATPRVIDVLESISGDINLMVENQPLVSDAAMSNTEIADLDSDGDGIPNFLEPFGLDTDGDGLPNKIDADDDGDNILTINEGVLIDENGQISSMSEDTDGDGIPNYLDTDDDGDGILTIQEDLDRDLNPENDITNGIPNYLNANVMITADPAIDTFIEHSYIRIPIITITIPSFVLTSGDETIIFDNFEDVRNFGTFTGERFQLLLTPAFVESPE